MFGMVFGAGILLFVMKKEATGKPVHGLFYRRMAWLVLFGLIHAHLVFWLKKSLLGLMLFGVIQAVYVVLQAQKERARRSFRISDAPLN